MKPHRARPKLRLVHRRTVLGLVALLAGCAATFSGVTVSIDAAKVVARANQTPQRAQVRVTDIRREANLERTAFAGASMGQITLKPPVEEIVQAVVEAQAEEVLARRGIAEPQTVVCGIRTFDITTPATALYWDVHATIELVLRVRGQDRVVRGVATERTFVWPSEQVIARVATAALRQLAAETEGVLTELFVAVP